MRRIMIKPDQMAVSAEPAVLESLAVGSSIVVCLYDGKKKIGGMVHTLLPEKIQNTGNAYDRLRYVDSAIEQLYRELLKLGAGPEDMAAKLAGGARIFCFSEQREQTDIGKANVSCARKCLRELKIPITSEDTGENYGRSVHFHVEDGRLEIETVNRTGYWI